MWFELVVKYHRGVGRFYFIFYLFSFTACVQVKSKLHAEGIPATGADIQGEKKNL